MTEAVSSQRRYRRVFIGLRSAPIEEDTTRPPPSFVEYAFLLVGDSLTASQMQKPPENRRHAGMRIPTGGRSCYNRAVSCCQEFEDLVEREMARVSAMHLLGEGRIINDIDTEFFLVFGEGRKSYVGINYCPFCGRVVSRGLWNREKKK